MLSPWEQRVVPMAADVLAYLILKEQQYERSHTA